MSVQCQFGNGICGRMTNDPSGLCWQHQNMLEPRIGIPDALTDAPALSHLLSDGEREQMLNDHLDDIATELRGVSNINDWLDSRYDDLNQAQPQMDCSFTGAVSRHGDPEEMWVPVDAITSVDGYGNLWGEINNRPDEMLKIARGLIDPDESRQEWLSRMRTDPVRLISAPGPYGDLYQIGSGGRHRITALKALGVKEWKCLVSQYRVASVGDEVSATANKEIERHLKQLHREGWITPPELRHIRNGVGFATFNVAKPITASWELEMPATVQAVSRRYAEVYPEFGHTSREADMMDAQRWSARMGLGERPKVAQPHTATEAPSRSRLRGWIDRIFG